MPRPFNAGNRPISFVNKCCYLECIIDNELTMVPEYKSVYRRIEHTVFLLGKLKYFIDSRAVLLVLYYCPVVKVAKETSKHCKIMPFEYAYDIVWWIALQLINFMLKQIYKVWNRGEFFSY